MNEVNRTLYIPLYGKSYVSKRNLFLKDEMAEKIWEKEAFALKGKSKSKWLAFYMGIRAAVFDDWVRAELRQADEAVVIHLGCGMDARVFRVGHLHAMWYDIDFPAVIRERKRYFTEGAHYTMLEGDARDGVWLAQIPKGKKAIVVMEGISMYLTSDELRGCLVAIGAHFEEVSLLVDCYTDLAAKLSRYKNPINEVGVTQVYGMDDPNIMTVGGFAWIGEREMTPKRYLDQLHGTEKHIFGMLYAGTISKKLYRLQEYRKRAGESAQNRL